MSWAGDGGSGSSRHVSDPRLDALALIHRYAELIDAGDFEGVAELLADARLTFEGQELVVEGRQAVLDLYTATTRRYEDGTPRTKHVVTNAIIEPGDESDELVARSYFTVLQAVPGHLSLQPVIAGRYRHRFRVVEEPSTKGAPWRIVALHITIDLTGDLAHHLLIDLTG